jgi:hypothetical protein
MDQVVIRQNIVPQQRRLVGRQIEQRLKLVESCKKSKEAAKSAAGSKRNFRFKKCTGKDGGGDSDGKKNTTMSISLRFGLLGSGMGMCNIRDNHALEAHRISCFMSLIRQDPIQLPGVSSSQITNNSEYFL